MKTKDLVIEDYLYYPDVDAFLIRGFRPAFGQNLPRAVVGWMQRATPENLICARSFPDMPAAVTAYQNAIECGEFPDKILEASDVQQHGVYDWEDRIMGNDVDRPVTDIESARKILREVCRDIKISCPKLVWLDNINSSDYDWDSNTIRFGHRSLMPLLHEIAHAIQNQKSSDEGNNKMHHSPGFVWDAMTLYNRYLGLDMSFLAQSAAMAGLLGPVRVDAPQKYVQAIQPKIRSQEPVPS